MIEGKVTNDFYFKKRGASEAVRHEFEAHVAWMEEGRHCVVLWKFFNLETQYRYATYGKLLKFEDMFDTDLDCFAQVLQCAPHWTVANLGV